MKNKLWIQKALLPALAVCGLLFSSCYKEFDPKTYQPVFSINGYSSSSEIGAALHGLTYKARRKAGIYAISFCAGNTVFIMAFKSPVTH